MIMDVDAYLRRLAVSAPSAPTLEFLRELHRAHVAVVPFENFAILEGRGVSLAPEDLAATVLRRGGYCLSLTAAFALLLEAPGYRVESVLGTVWSGPIPTPGPRQPALRIAVSGERVL